MFDCILYKGGPDILDARDAGQFVDNKVWEDIQTFQRDLQDKVAVARNLVTLQDFIKHRDGGPEIVRGRQLVHGK